METTVTQQTRTPQPHEIKKKIAELAEKPVRAHFALRANGVSPSTSKNGSTGRRQQ
jgi:hypothetical protein